MVCYTVALSWAQNVETCSMTSKNINILLVKNCFRMTQICCWIFSKMDQSLLKIKLNLLASPKLVNTPWLSHMTDMVTHNFCWATWIKMDSRNWSLCQDARKICFLVKKCQFSSVPTNILNILHIFDFPKTFIPVIFYKKISPLTSQVESDCQSSESITGWHCFLVTSSIVRLTLQYLQKKASYTSRRQW